MEFKVKNQKRLAMFLTEKEIKYDSDESGWWMWIHYDGDVFRLYEEFMDFIRKALLKEDVQSDYDHGLITTQELRERLEKINLGIIK
jgi:hypothetical protein